MYRKLGKRLFDILFAIILLPFLGVLVLMVGVAILIDDHGTAFYVADRLGKDGKIFKMYKFRSMKINAPDLRNDDGTTFNSENDIRVTRVGKFLRKTSLDEIPQILNILIGDMSFIGPRPDLPDTIYIYSKEDKKKLSVLPGITGYSQAYYRNSSTLKQRFEGDVYYAEHVSFLLDFKIIIKTIQMVFLQKNIYRNKGDQL